MEINNINAVFFVTHIINNEVLDRYYELERDVKDIVKLFLLLHREEDENNIPESEFPENITPYIFNIDSLDKLDYEPIEDTITPGSNHFATLQFFLDHPDFKYYWVIEYDVIYTGKWTNFFLDFDSIDADFIASHIERFSDRPFWYWWDTLHLDSVTLQKHQLIKSFNPIYRISNNALKFLDTLLKGHKNWGHHEVLIPTALKHWGFSILDFGGNGEFVLPQFEERFYLMPSQYVDGTMRDKPQMNEEELLIKDRLLHPVKTSENKNKPNKPENNLRKISTHVGSQEELLKLNNEILWGQIFQDTIRSSSWLKNKSFSPGRWAAGCPMLYLIYRIIQGIRPQNILEFGLGESSKLTLQYTIAYPEVYLNIIEQDPNWLKFFENEMPNVSSYVIIHPIEQIPIEYNMYINQYKNLHETIKEHIYDLIIIDGSWGSPWHSRNQILNIIVINWRKVL